MASVGFLNVGLNLEPLVICTSNVLFRAKREPNRLFR
jgi:hypothetical protein